MTTINLLTNTTASVAGSFGYNFYSTMVGGGLGAVKFTSNDCIEIGNYNYLDRFPHVTHNLSGDTLNKVDFVVNWIRIYKAAHSFDDSIYEGELVAKCEVTDSSSSVYTYVVIPLSSTSSEGASGGVLDMLIAKAKGGTLDSSFRLRLNDLIPVDSRGSGNVSGATGDPTAYAYAAPSNSLSGSVSASIEVVVLSVAIPINSDSVETLSTLNTMYGTNVPTTITGVESGVRVHSPSSISSDDIYVDCSPEDENEGEDEGSQRKFRLTEKDISDICTAILFTLFWATAWAIINECYKKKRPAMLQNLAEFMIKELFRSITFGGFSIMVMSFTMVVLFMHSFYARSVSVFKGAFYLLTAIFDLLFCSSLDVFNLSSMTASHASHVSS
jgi:hypothetical protein